MKKEYNALLLQCYHLHSEPPGFEQEIPTRIPPPDRGSQGSLPRRSHQPYPHEQSQEPARFKYDDQPEFKHVQRRMHPLNRNDPNFKQKVQNRRSMPELNQGKSFAAPRARIMDQPTLAKAPGAGPPKGVGPDALPRVPPASGSGRAPQPQQPGPGGDQRKPGPPQGNLIQVSVHWQKFKPNLFVFI